jgi:hypothetical protein
MRILAQIERKSCESFSLKSIFSTPLIAGVREKYGSAGAKRLFIGIPPGHAGLQYIY